MIFFKIFQEDVMMSFIGIMLLFIGAACMDSEVLTIPFTISAIAMVCLVIGSIKDGGDRYDAE
jgi:membrane-bound ClpP family serine protease